MATLGNWIIQDEVTELTAQEWSRLNSVINKNFWNLIYKEEPEWDA